MESLESDTDKERASLLSILSKVHYIIQKYMKKKHTYFFINCVLLLARTVQVENFEGVNFRAIQYSVLFGKFRG